MNPTVPNQILSASWPAPGHTPPHVQVAVMLCLFFYPNISNRFRTTAVTAASPRWATPELPAMIPHFLAQ